MEIRRILPHLFRGFFLRLGDTLLRSLVRLYKFPFQFRDLFVVPPVFRFGFLIIQHSLNQSFILIPERDNVVNLVFQFGLALPCELFVDLRHALRRIIGCVLSLSAALFLRLDFFRR